MTQNIAHDPIINAWRNMFGSRVTMESLLFHHDKEVADTARLFIVIENHIETIMHMPAEIFDTLH